jgi:hypothetical protein
MPSSYEPTVEGGIVFCHLKDRVAITDAFERLKTTDEGYEMEFESLSRALPAAHGPTVPS